MKKKQNKRMDVLKQEELEMIHGGSAKTTFMTSIYKEIYAGLKNLFS